MDILRLRLQRVISENQSYRSLYHQQLASISISSDDRSMYWRSEISSFKRKEKELQKIDRLKTQVRHVQAQLAEATRSLHQMQYEQDCMRRQLASVGLVPSIISLRGYLMHAQSTELTSIQQFAQLYDQLDLSNPSDQKEWKGFLQSTMRLPSCLHPLFVYNYTEYAELRGHCLVEKFTICPIHSSSSFSSSSFTDICQRTKERWLGKISNEVQRARTLYSSNPMCCNEMKRMNPPSNQPLFTNALASFWKDRMIGKSDGQRLFTLLQTGRITHYDMIKQVVFDYLQDHPDVIQEIHQLEDLPYEECHPILCCHCCVYITTVASALLFDLTGLMSTITQQRQVCASELVSV